MGRFLDAVESFEGKNRVGELISPSVEHGTREGEKLLRHRLRIGEGSRLPRGVVMVTLVHAVIGGDAHPGPERMLAANLQTIVLYPVELVGQGANGCIAKPVIIVPSEAALIERDRAGEKHRE